jgi:hypothetical protein
MPAVPFAFTRAGKPLQVGDAVSVIGTVTAVSGSGPTASVTVQWAGSGNTSANVQAQDVAAGGQTL